jgi:hypothetical protein
VEAIVCATEEFIELARNGLPVFDYWSAVQAAAGLETALNPDRLPFTFTPALNPDSDYNPLNDPCHRGIPVAGWNRRITSGLKRVRAESHDFMADWSWDDLSQGKDPEKIPRVMPMHEDWLARLDGMEKGLALIRKGLEEEPETPASAITAEPSEEEQRRPRELAIDQGKVTFGPSPTVTLEGKTYPVSNERPPDALAGAPSGKRDSAPLATADPLTQAIEKISQSRKGADLLRYLANQPERKASLDQIAVDLDKARKETAARWRGRIRQRYLRTRDLLEKEEAPVRLNIVNHVVELVIAPSPPERTTPM